MKQRIISLIMTLVMAFATVGTMGMSVFAASSSTYITSSTRHTDAQNEFTNTQYTIHNGRVDIYAKHIYYIPSGIRCEYYCTNGLNHDVAISKIKDYQLSSNQGLIAWGNITWKASPIVRAHQAGVIAFNITDSKYYNSGMQLNVRNLHTHYDIFWTKMN